MKKFKTSKSSIHTRPAEILQKLLRFDTTNPPGNEGECITYIRSLLTNAGIKSTLLAHTKNRPNLIARLPGTGSAAPILLYGHVGVVTVENQKWRVPPLVGKKTVGFLWWGGSHCLNGRAGAKLPAFLRTPPSPHPCPLPPPSPPPPRVK